MSKKISKKDLPRHTRPPRGPSGRPRGGYKFPLATVIKAVEGSGGLYNEIAERVSKITGQYCARSTIVGYARRETVLREAIESEKETMIDSI